MTEAREVHATTAPPETLDSQGMRDPDKVWELALEPQFDALDDGLKRYIAVCRERLGLIPNVISANALDSERLRTFADSYNRLMLGDGSLSKAEREMIAVLVSSINRCFYCLVAHGAALREVTGDPILAEAIAFNYRAADLSPRHRAILDFAAKLTTDPASMDEPDREALRAAGCDDRTILEVAEVAGFFNMSNRIAAATGMLPNPEYHALAR